MPGSSPQLANQFVTKNIDDDTPEVETMAYGKRRDYEWQIVWRNVLAFIYLHGAATYGFYLIFTGRVMLNTILFAVLFSALSGMGVTAGAHRLWAHRSYKARWPLRVFLALLQTMAFQNHIYEWVRDHRVHHKFTETDADPHNAKRGFFFSHMGWLMVRKHKAVFEKGAHVDMSDLEKDPIVMFQKNTVAIETHVFDVRKLASLIQPFLKYFAIRNVSVVAWGFLSCRTYMVAVPLFCFILPAYVPVALWGENPWVSWYAAAITRYTITLHFTWLVNSAAHIWGNKPYDKYIGATDNKAVAICAFGEGWHNYHHVFPWDYKAAELGDYSTNLSTGLIDLAAKWGLAYDLKTVSADMITKRVTRTGDGSHPSDQKVAAVEDDHHHPENPVWGWDDLDMPDEERKMAEIVHRKTE